MDRIRLILADPDSKYVDKVTDFINTNYRSRIKVTSFTRLDALENYLSSLTDKTDILLANPVFLNLVPALCQNLKMVVALSDGSFFEEINTPTISKYQPGNQLISKLLEAYGRKYDNAANLVRGPHDTRVIAIYSPVGGAGKTSMTVGLAAKLSDTGKSVLCLSFETINSMISSLSYVGNEAMSHIILSLSENNPMLPVKLEMYKTRDSILQFDFIEPPGCFSELSEIMAEDLEQLLLAFRDTGKYDYILVDLDSAADPKILSVFKVSDQVLLICVPDEIALFKTESFLKQLRKMGSLEDSRLPDKLLFVMNKQTGELAINREVAGFNINYAVPFVEGLWSFNGAKASFDLSRDFIGSLSPVARALIK